jgi:hypothetical protein
MITMSSYWLDPDRSGAHEAAFAYLAGWGPYELERIARNEAEHWGDYEAEPVTTPGHSATGPVMTAPGCRTDW